jgi:hypothetical protein
LPGYDVTKGSLRARVPLGGARTASARYAGAPR